MRDTTDINIHEGHAYHTSGTPATPQARLPHLRHACQTLSALATAVMDSPKHRNPVVIRELSGAVLRFSRGPVYFWRN